MLPRSKRREFSLIIPAYNAIHTLERCVQKVRKVAKNEGLSYTILIAEDGSTDGTDKLAARLAREHTDIVILHHDKRLGRGQALTRALAYLPSTYAVYIDADLDIDPSYLKDFIAGFQQGYNIITVSKRHPQSQVKSPLIRKFLSHSYHFLVRRILDSRIYDHQGGMKGVDQKTIRTVLPLVEDSRWFWDTELLVIGQWKGLKILEIPITANYAMHRSTVRQKDVIDMLIAIYKLKKRERSIKKQLLKHAS